MSFFKNYPELKVKFGCGVCNKEFNNKAGVCPICGHSVLKDFKLERVVKISKEEI